jgi:hypothetical protein
LSLLSLNPQKKILASVCVWRAGPADVVQAKHAAHFVGGVVRPVHACMPCHRVLAWLAVGRIATACPALAIASSEPPRYTTRVVRPPPYCICSYILYCMSWRRSMQAVLNYTDTMQENARNSTIRVSLSLHLSKPMQRRRRNAYTRAHARRCRLHLHAGAEAPAAGRATSSR